MPHKPHDPTPYLELCDAIKNYRRTPVPEPIPPGNHPAKLVSPNTIEITGGPLAGQHIHLALQPQPKPTIHAVYAAFRDFQQHMQTAALEHATSPRARNKAISDATLLLSTKLDEMGLDLDWSEEL